MEGIGICIYVCGMRIWGFKMDVGIFLFFFWRVWVALSWIVSVSLIVGPYCGRV